MTRPSAVTPELDLGSPHPRTAAIHAVLCNPQDVRNVGGAIRAAANHGLAGLRIVTHEAFDSEDLFHFSSESLPTLPVTFHTELDDALDCMGLVIGTSRRTRDPLSPPNWPAAGLAARLPEGVPVAILFGNERTGLTRPEVDRCTALVYVPTHDRMPSLNLAQAVAIIGYELARPAPEQVGPAAEPAEVLRAPRAAIEGFYGHVAAVADALGYPPGRNPELFARKLRRLFDRANPDAHELALLAGVFSEMRRLAGLRKAPLGRTASLAPTEEVSALDEAAAEVPETTD